MVVWYQLLTSEAPGMLGACEPIRRSLWEDPEHGPRQAKRVVLQNAFGSRQRFPRR